MNCSVDYSVFGRVADHCGQQQVLGYLVLAILIATVFLVVAIASQKENSNGYRTSRPVTPRPTPAKTAPQADEELPELAPVAASVAPEVEPVAAVAAVAVVEPAPAPVVDPVAGWGRPVIDEAALSTPAYIRRAGITPYAAYRRLNPLKTSVVLLSKVREPEPDSMPVFDLGERMLVGFDGVPVH